MEYTRELLQKHLGDKFDPKADYVLEVPWLAVSRVHSGNHRVVGEVPDFSQDPNGKMIVLERTGEAKSPEPKTGQPVSRAGRFAPPGRVPDSTPPRPAAVSEPEPTPAKESVAKKIYSRVLSKSEKGAKK